MGRKGIVFQVSSGTEEPNRVKKSASEKDPLSRLIKISIAFIAVAVILLAVIYAIDAYRTSWNTNSVNRVTLSLEQRVRKNPRDLALRLVLGKAYISNGRVDDGIDQFKQVLKVDPNQEDAMMDLGLAYQKINETKKAEDQFRSVIAANELAQYRNMNKTLEAAFYYLAASQFKRGDFRDAEINVREALKIGSTNSDTRLLMGRVLLELKKYKEAEQNFRKSTELDPKYADAHYGRGLALEKMGKLKEAAASFKTAAELSPSSRLPAAALKRVKKKLAE